MPRRLLLTIVGVLVLACGDEDGILRPEVVAASKFIDYGTWADTTSVCMDDRLARLDRYIEETSSFLGIDPPAQRILYVWVPEGKRHDDTWPCADAPGCVRRGDPEYQIIAYVTRDEALLHELAHAVEIPAFGGSHWVFREGIAEYLSKSRSLWGATGAFPAAFAEMLGRDQGSPRDYRVAMHFVGSLIERDGLDKYLEYRALVPFDGDLADFARAHEQVYDEDLYGALAAMDRTELARVGPLNCDEEIGSERIEIDGSGEHHLVGECGDGNFFSQGGAPGELSASKSFWLDLKSSGYYELTLRGAAPPRCHPGSRSSAVPG